MTVLTTRRAIPATDFGRNVRSARAPPGIAVAESKLHRLKVYSEGAPAVTRPEIEGVGSLPALLGAFSQATGWRLSYCPGPEPTQPADLTWSAPVNPGVGIPPGHLRLDPAGSSPTGSPPKTVDPQTARNLASAVAEMLGELMHTRCALWQREAELAAGVPVIPHPKEEQHLAARLQAVLKAGAEAVGAQAAGLYMIDEATTELKLRAAWGLAPGRLTAGARPLKGALADLEALLGHAVVLEDTALMQRWKVPEEGFGAAVCVPVSTSTTILGTLWILSTAKRDFNPHETNIIEVVAGRLASDLEREMLMREGVQAAGSKHRLAAAGRLQQSQFPSIPPLLEGWQVAGWTEQAEEVGGDLFDWFVLDDGRLAVSVGDALQEGIDAALVAATLRAAFRCHARYRPDGHRLLEQVNLTIWTGSAGDQYASLFFGLVDPGAGKVRYAMAGDPAAVLLRPDGCRSLSAATPPLGESPETIYRQRQCQLRPGEALLVFTDGVRDAADGQGRPLGEAGLAEPLRAGLHLPATELASLARDRLHAHAAAPQRHDRTVLVLKRTAS